jgi:hypothetical protein
MLAEEPMPLRDHFNEPIYPRHSWQGFHAMWPANLVTRLVERLPEEFIAEPRVNLGKYYEIDIGAMKNEPFDSGTGRNGGGVATLPRVAPKPTMTTVLEIRDQYAYEVHVYEDVHEMRLVAAVEFVSPANKDRPDHRKAFVAKCVSLIQAGVSVSIIDVVTTRNFNLYEEVLDYLDKSDAALLPAAPGLYIATCRARMAKPESQFETWFYPLELGEAIPELPIWLDDYRHVMLDLEGSYEQTCKTLRIA